jgi:hypothetical protein
MKCGFHPKLEQQECSYCTKWRKTFKYFKERNCSHLTLYCAELTHYRTKEKFYKIGLTSKTTDQRFDETRERFDVKIQWEVKTGLYSAVTKETTLLYSTQVDQGRRYKPKAQFSGQTECFK